MAMSDDDCNLETESLTLDAAPGSKVGACNCRRSAAAQQGPPADPERALDRRPQDDWIDSFYCALRHGPRSKFLWQVRREAAAQTARVQQRVSMIREEL